MKPVRTPESNVTLTLPGGTQDNDLPATRALLYDTTLGETQEDAAVGWVTIWQPDDAEARALEAGACVELTIRGPGHPPVSVGVTRAVVPERELIDRGHVDRAVGALYALLKERAEGSCAALPTLSTLGEPAEFVDLWTQAVNATRPAEAGGAGDPDAPPPDPDTDETGDLTAAAFRGEIARLVGDGTTFDVDSIPGGDGTGLMIRTTAHGRAVMAQGATRRDVVSRLRRAVEDVAVAAEHAEDPPA